MTSQTAPQPTDSLCCPNCGEDCILGPDPRDRECVHCDVVFCVLEPLHGWQQAPAIPGQRTLWPVEPGAAGTLWERGRKDWNTLEPQHSGQ